MGKKGGSDVAAQARADEQARQEKIREGTTRVNDIFGKNFNDGFYNSRQTAYSAFAKPQLDQQHKDAQAQLAYDLARSGTLDSSIRADKASELQRLYDTNARDVADKALAYKNQTMNSVEDARAGLIQTLNATGDAEGAANSALTRAKALSQPQAFSPLAPLFSTFTSGLAQQAALEKAASYGAAAEPRYKTGLFKSANAVDVNG